MIDFIISFGLFQEFIRGTSIEKYVYLNNFRDVTWQCNSLRLKKHIRNCTEI